jgi:hypothetical protein
LSRRLPVVVSLTQSAARREPDACRFIVGKSACGIYGAVTLFAGDIVFDEIGMLEAHEFDGKAIFNVAHNAALSFSNRHDDAHAGKQRADAGAGGTVAPASLRSSHPCD